MDPYQNPSSYFLPSPITTTTSLSSLINQEHQDRDRDRDRDRFPQWTQAETRELLSIRAELDRSFTVTKRNKPLWETMATRMNDKGFVRTPEQCKSKWKNLVTRYKGSEAMEGDRQFPYHEEMKSIIDERGERALRGKEKVEDDDDDEEEEEGGEAEEAGQNRKRKKRRKVVKKGVVGVEEALREFGRRQMEMEMRWMAAAEEREVERRVKEEEWRRRMVALQEERMEMERRWREKEEERRTREEAREERRHSAITAILSKIRDKWS